MQNFFSKGNLTALRELAMRAAADRVDAQLQAHMRANAIGGPWPAQERILVAINEAPIAKDLVRTAKRMADRARVEWITVTVASAETEILSDSEKDTLAGALRLAERLGAEIATLPASRSVTEELIDFSRRRNVSRIVLGRPRQRPIWRRFGRENIARHLMDSARDFEVTLVSEPPEMPRKPARSSWNVERDFRRYVEAIGIVAIACIAAWLADSFLPVPSLSLIFMTGVILVAVRAGLWPSLAAALVSFLVYNFMFTDPRGTLLMVHRDQFLTLALFLVASILTGNLAARMRSRAIAHREIAERTNLLYDFARQAAIANSPDEVMRAAAVHVGRALDCEVVLLVAGDPPGRLRVAAAEPAVDQLGYREMSAAEYAWDHGEEAGRGSGTLPSSRWLFRRLTTGERRLAVLGIAYSDERSASPMDRRLLDALIDQAAVALERTELSRDLEQSRIDSEAERLRSALLSSVSHDLRTPLVSIIGAASSLADPEIALPGDARLQMAETIRDEGERLDRYIQNLLDMTRLGYGALKLQRVPADLRELAGHARQRLRNLLRDHNVVVSIPEALPPVLVDPILIEQVLINLLDNAAKYTPAGSRITVAARIDGARTELSVADEGPGIPLAARERIFDMFYRAEAGDGQCAGTGLGLAIARGIVEAHGGSIHADAVKPDGSGTRIVLSLPLANPEDPR